MNSSPFLLPILWMASRKGRLLSPGIPKTYLTPSRTRHSTRISPPESLTIFRRSVWTWIKVHHKLGPSQKQ
jgi:hypothetical protein